MEVGSRNEAGLLQDRADNLVGGAGIRRRLKDDEHPRAQVVSDRRDRRDHRAEVRPALVRQRGGHADHDGSGLGEAARVGGGLKAGGPHLGDIVIAEVVHVGAASVKPVDHAGGDIKSKDLEPHAARLLGQWQADVAEANDGDVERHHETPCADEAPETDSPGEGTAPETSRWVGCRAPGV